LVRRHALEKRIIFSSFFAWNLRKAAQFLPEVPRGLLTKPGVLGLWGRSFGFAFGDYQALHPYVTEVTVQQVQRVHRLKRMINVWTVDKEEEIRRLMAWGVDGFITSDPALVVRVARGTSA
jgi:glycerophosphoryl diester phosphodiesterase